MLWVTLGAKAMYKYIRAREEEGNKQLNKPSQYNLHLPASALSPTSRARASYPKFQSTSYLSPILPQILLSCCLPNSDANTVQITNPNMPNQYIYREIYLTIHHYSNARIASSSTKKHRQKP
jgi:hypothetical protein